MRLILSRKGFDSSNGGCASPILPDGRLLSLPIPSSGGRVRYRELQYDGVDVAELVSDLTGGKVAPDDPAHLDPDLLPAVVPRAPGWRPAFGQVDTAQIHLANQRVGPGDLFLFFGWFREVERISGSWRFRRGAPDLHVLLGWLQVDEVLDVARDRQEALRRHPWLESHPHLWTSAVPNVIYVAAQQLRVSDLKDGALPGAGVFPRLSPGIVLTKSGQRLRSVWRLPACFLPCEGLTPLSYHEAPNRWALEADGVELHTVGRGQEFVLDLVAYPGVARWAVSTLKNHRG
jgi:hypothetical protein